MIGINPPKEDLTWWQNRRYPAQVSPFLQGGQTGQGAGGNGFLDTFMNIARSTVPWSTQQLANRRKTMMDAETKGLVSRYKSFNDLLRQNAMMQGILTPLQPRTPAITPTVTPPQADTGLPSTQPYIINPATGILDENPKYAKKKQL